VLTIMLALLAACAGQEAASRETAERECPGLCESTLACAPDPGTSADQLACTERCLLRTTNCMREEMVAPFAACQRAAACEQRVLNECTLWIDPIPQARFDFHIACERAWEECPTATTETLCKSESPLESEVILMTESKLKKLTACFDSTCDRDALEKCLSAVLRGCYLSAS
jgi:hypothetical protein